MYNYKGGVGKTTNLIQLATTLARRGERTLMVDADPQCNLTSFFKPRVDDEDQEEAQEMTEEEQEAADEAAAAAAAEAESDWGVGSDSQIQCENLKGNVTQHDVMMLRNDNSVPSLHSALRPAFTGNINNLVAQDLEPLPGEGLRGNLFLLAGSTHIVRYEQSLSLVDANDATAVPLLGAFRRLVTLTAKHVGARIVLVDFGPSSGILNQVFVMSCDYILPPCFADFYSICSADGFLKSLLPMWIIWQQRTLAKQVDRIQDAPDHERFAFNPTTPRVLPFIITKYKMFYGGNCVAGPSTQWILDLKRLAEGEDLNPEIKACMFPLSNYYVIPLLEDVGQLIQHSHESKRAIIELTDATLGAPPLALKSKERKDLMRRVNTARTRYGYLAKALRLLP